MKKSEESGAMLEQEVGVARIETCQGNQGAQRPIAKAALGVCFDRYRKWRALRRTEKLKAQEEYEVGWNEWCSAVTGTA